MSNPIGPKVPFNLETVGKLNVPLEKAANETKRNKLDEVFVAAGNDDYVLYGKNGNLKDVKIGQQISFTNTEGESVSGTVKQVNDENNTFFQGVKGTFTSIPGRIASLSAPAVGTVLAVGYIPIARASAAAAAQKAITPGSVSKFFDIITRMPTHEPTLAELAAAAKKGAESVSAKNILIGGAIIGGVVAVAIPVTGGILASKALKDDSKLREYTGLAAKELPDTINPEAVSTSAVKNSKSIYGDTVSREDAENWLKGNPKKASDKTLLGVADYKGDGVIDADELTKAANNKVVVLNGIHSFYLPGEVKEEPKVIEKTIVREKVIVKKKGKSAGEQIEDIETTGKIVGGVAKGVGGLVLKAMGGGR